MSYGKNIKRRREELGMTQEDLAKACGYQSKSSISKIESGETDLTQSKLIEIAYALKTTPGALFEPINQDKSKQKKSFKDHIMTNILGFPDPDSEENEDLFYAPYELYDSQELKYRFSNNLRFLLNNEHMNNTMLANKIGVSESAVGKWLSGSILPRANMQLKIADFFGVKRSELFVDPKNKLDTIETEPLPPDCFPIQKKTFPLLGNIACGEPLLIDEQVEAYVTASDDIHADFCIRAHGDSMINARINDGDIIFIRKQPTVENGQIAAVRVDDIDGGRATLKRVYYDQNTGIIQLVAENPLYPTKVYSGEQLNAVEIIGLAVALQSIIK